MGKRQRGWDKEGGDKGSKEEKPETRTRKENKVHPQNKKWDVSRKPHAADNHAVSFQKHFPDVPFKSHLPHTHRLPKRVDSLLHDDHSCIKMHFLGTMLHSGDRAQFLHSYEGEEHSLRPTHTRLQRLHFSFTYSSPTTFLRLYYLIRKESCSAPLHKWNHSRWGEVTCPWFNE